MSGNGHTYIYEDCIHSIFSLSCITFAGARNGWNSQEIVRPSLDFSRWKHSLTHTWFVFIILKMTNLWIMLEKSLFIMLSLQFTSLWKRKVLTLVTKLILYTTIYHQLDHISTKKKKTIWWAKFHLKVYKFGNVLWASSGVKCSTFTWILDSQLKEWYLL